MNRREKAARKARKKKDRQKAHRAPSARAPLPIDLITLAPSVHMDCGGERVPATCAEYKARIESSLVMTADGKKTALELCNEPGHTHMRCLKCGQVSHIGGYMSSFDFDDDGELEMMGDLDEDDEGEPCCIECGSTEHLVRHDEGLRSYRLPSVRRRGLRRLRGDLEARSARRDSHVSARPAERLTSTRGQGMYPS